jgi:putative membrane protein
VHVPAYLAGQAMSLVASWRREGRIDGYGQLSLDPHMRALMDISGACERIKSTPIPGSYLALVRYLLAVYVLGAPFFIIHETGAWGIPIVLFLLFPMLALEVSAESIEEPFGTEADDLRLESMIRGIADVLGDLVDEDLLESGSVADGAPEQHRVSFTSLYRPVKLKP